MEFKIIELMQSTIFGCRIDNDNEELITRFDYDEYFGTVINRFIVQLLLKRKLTVYGAGNQRTGIMSLKQAVNEINSIVLVSKKYKKWSYCNKQLSISRFYNK